MDNLEEKSKETFERYNIPADEQETASLYLPQLKEHSLMTYNHSLRVGLLCAEIGEFLNFEQQGLQKIFFAGTMHDIGKLKVRKTLVAKAEGYTQEDREEMKAHVLHGYEMLKARHPFIAEIEVRHHLFQSNAYPAVMPEPSKKMSAREKKLIPIYSKLLSLADFYDADAVRKHEKYGDENHYEHCANLSTTKEKLLKEKSDMGCLIEKLYKAGVFK